MVHFTRKKQFSAVVTKQMKEGVHSLVMEISTPSTGLGCGRYFISALGLINSHLGNKKINNYVKQRIVNINGEFNLYPTTK